MIKKFILLVLFALLVSISALSAQEKYAVLITGDYAGTGVPQENLWNGGEGVEEDGNNTYPEFWYDTYLMWEMLVYEKGYDSENVFVIFADGVDYSSEDMWDRYDASFSHPEHFPITDYSATITNVETVFNGLASGIGDFPLVTENDFLFVWTFGHGGNAGGTHMNLINGESISDNALAALTDPILAHKKVFWMQQCSAGGFVEELEGVNTIFHSASQWNQKAHVADNLLNDETTEMIEWDFFDGLNGNRHGEFNFHLYSAMVGESPAYEEEYYGELYTEADENEDNYISIIESKNWEFNKESGDKWDYSGEEPTFVLEDPLYSDLGNIGNNTSLEYPTLLFSDISEGEDLSYKGLIGISKNISINENSTFTIENGAEIYLLNGSDLSAENGSILIIEDGVELHLLNDSKFFAKLGSSIIIGDNVTIYGRGENSLSFHSDVLIGNNVLFLSETGDPLRISINNQVQVFDNSTFKNCDIYSGSLDLQILDSDFENCGIVESIKGNVSVLNSFFDRTGLTLGNKENSEEMALVDGCTFYGGEDLHHAIEIWSYNNYKVTNNTIDYTQDFAPHGIMILQSGYGKLKDHLVKNNYVNEAYFGVLGFESMLEITNNEITMNRFGISLQNNCNSRINGNSNAQSYAQTQYIHDNKKYELHIMENSFPEYLHYNVIIDEDNWGGQEDALLRYYTFIGEIGKDITLNCWGYNFDPLEDLCPESYPFTWEPTWCPIFGGGNPTTSSASILYETANTQFEAGDYINAQLNYKSLVNQYSYSKYAKEALQKLFAIEKYVNNNYDELKSYYKNDSIIQSDTLLKKKAEFIASKCDIKLENWQEAIDYHEQVVQFPETFHDSIYAIIDLGYVYLRMEDSGDKSAYVGKMTEFKPTTREAYFEHRDYLLSILMGDNMNKDLKEKLDALKEGELLQNNPNPFNDRTKIYYKVNKESDIELMIYNTMGQLVQFYNEGAQTEGTYFVTMEKRNLPVGLYYYSLSVNGRRTDSKKMTIIK